MKEKKKDKWSRMDQRRHQRREEEEEDGTN